MIRIKNLFFICLLFPASLMAQQTEKELRGRVMEDTTAVADVHIYNLTTDRGAISDPEGYFQINVHPGDTLTFSALRYFRKEMVVNTDIFDSPFIVVRLELFVNELDEVVLNPFGLTGSLDEDVNRIQTDPVITAETLGLPNANVKPLMQSERLLREASMGALNLGTNTSIPLNPIINAITGRTKMLKKRVKRDRLYNKSERIRRMYADSLFTDQLGIPLERIPDFMYFCEVDPEFKTLEEWDSMRIWGLLVRKSAVYRKNNALE